jgi:hypothetical protein
MRHKSYYLTWQGVLTVRSHNVKVNATQKPNSLPQSFCTKLYAFVELPDLLPCWCDSNALHYYSGGDGFQSWRRNQISSYPPCKQHDRASIMARPQLCEFFTFHYSPVIQVFDVLCLWYWRHNETNYKEKPANRPHTGPAWHARTHKHNNFSRFA